MTELFDRLVDVDLGDLDTEKDRAAIVEAYIRAAFVAAQVPYNAPLLHFVLGGIHALTNRQMSVEEAAALLPELKDFAGAPTPEGSDACDHEWGVFSTVPENICLLVQCVECGACGNQKGRCK